MESEFNNVQLKQKTHALDKHPNSKFWHRHSEAFLLWLVDVSSNVIISQFITYCLKVNVCPSCLHCWRWSCGVPRQCRSIAVCWMVHLIPCEVTSHWKKHNIRSSHEERGLSVRWFESLQMHSEGPDLQLFVWSFILLPTLSEQWRLWRDCMDAQAHRSLRYSHMW